MKKKIFLADDSITIQKVVELTFSEGNYEVVCVGNGAAAMQRIGDLSPDIALLDVIMPERSGYEICAHLKKDKDLAWMPVLLLTGAFEPYDENRAKEAGADGHMTKPFESRALVSRVESLLAAHPRPGTAPAPPRQPEPAAQPAAPPSPAPSAQTQRIKTSELHAQPPAPAAQPPAPAAQRPAPATPAASNGPVDRPRAATGGAERYAPPPEMVEKAVREAVAGITEKIVREVAWEVIPDLAEAIIRRRIRELEAEAER